MEKLITLEVENIVSLSHKLAQNADELSLDDLVGNLEANINRRGNFQILFQKNGQPEKVSLNKDHALAIISPAPFGMESKYPHVLTNVVPHAKMVNSIPEHLCTYLHLEGDLTEFHCVSMIWESLYCMFKIVQKEPNHKLIDPDVEGSLRPSDYSWGYSEEQIKDYKFHAERLYQLFCLKYTWNQLTPYTMKFIDYGLFFMKRLQIPFCRFSTEGGEHSNYLHNCFYYQHTTRHGGKGKYDPTIAVFSSLWKRLAYEINNNTDSDNVSVFFNSYVERHVAARKI